MKINSQEKKFIRAVRWAGFKRGLQIWRPSPSHEEVKALIEKIRRKHIL